MPYTQVTRAQLRGLLRNRLGNAAATFWRDDELNTSAIQPALRLFNLLTGFWKRRALFNTVAGQVWYPLPSSITSNLRVSWRDFPLSPSSFYDLDFGRPIWESETTVSGGDVPTQPKVYSIGALNLIAIWPADAAGSNSLIVDGIAATPILSTDASFVDIGQEELSGLLDCAQMLAVFKESGKELTEALEVFKKFLKSAGERNSILLASSTYHKFLGLDTLRQKKPYKLEGERLGAR
jgi:hypothetical protein